MDVVSGGFWKVESFNHALGCADGMEFIADVIGLVRCAIAGFPIRAIDLKFCYNLNLSCS